MKKNNKILFFVTEDWYFISHRIKLAEHLIKKGFQVSVCCKDTGKASLIQSKGINLYNIDIKRKSISFFQFFFEVIAYIKLAKKVKPDIIHFISMRPIITGLLASLIIKSKFCATFTGMGFLFIKKGLVGFFLKLVIINFIKFSLLFKKIKIIVQNEDDLVFFQNKLKNRKFDIIKIRGSGINLSYYKKLKEPEEKNIKILYVGRLLEDKGVLWLIESFKKAKYIYKNIELYIAGSLDEKNPTGISKKKLNTFLKIKGIRYFGNVEDVRKLWSKSNIAILLSKREGLPLSLMEAAAVGRAIIATNVPGCREIAIHKYNSITVEPGDIYATRDAILKLSRNKKIRRHYAANSRKLVESDMSLVNICEQYYKLYNSL